MAIVKESTSVGEDGEKSKPLCAVGGGTATMENSMEIPEKTKNRYAI